MPKFAQGSPQVHFRKRNGTRFVMTYHGSKAAADSIRAWRKKGGQVLKIGAYAGGTRDYQYSRGRNRADRRHFSGFISKLNRL